MSVYKDKNGKWKVYYRYTDWTGKKKQTTKRGFETKREAVAWEREQHLKMKSSLNMTFGSFVEIYITDMRRRVRKSTMRTKESIIREKILPYFADRKIDEIMPRDIIAWQNEVMELSKENGEPYSQTYLRAMHSQISAIFNHAVAFYGLRSNPAEAAGSMGEADSEEMKFWTQEEYLKFSESMMEKPMSFYAFEMLYWTGIREGELLALTPADLDFNAGTVRINKTYQRLDGEDVITPPKTHKSNRVVRMPDFLVEEMQEFLRMLYGVGRDERIFNVTKYYLHHEMDRGAKESGVERIRIHDLRHSHVSLLIELGFSAVAIGDRVGHESVVITYRYAHMFPSTQDAMARELSMVRNRQTGENADRDQRAQATEDEKADTAVRSMKRETFREAEKENEESQD